MTTQPDPTQPDPTQPDPTQPDPTRPDPSHLVSGYATDTLSPAERRRLWRAALDDQEVFDQLVEEESWRQIFSAPGVRQELLEALAEPAQAAEVAPQARPRRVAGGWRAWLGSLRGTPRGSRRYLPSMAMGAAAAALLAVALIPRWLELGVVGPVGPGEAPPSVAGPPATDAPAVELVPKGFDRQPGAAGDAPAPELVAKSHDGPDPEAADAPASATRSLQPKSTGSDYLNLSYTLELNQPDGPRQVAEGWAFGPGDQFRLRLGVDFTAWLYLFNRAAGETAYTVLYPHTAAERNPLPPSQRDVLLPAGVWLTMDDTPEDEHLVLVVSNRPWPLAAGGRETVAAGELNAAIEQAERRLDQLSWRRSEAEGRVRLTVGSEDEVVLVAKLLP